MYCSSDNLDQVTYEPENVLVTLCSKTPDKYEFGFNGQMKVNEIVGGVGNWNTAEFWEYSTRTARRMNLDPVKHPWESRYAVFGGNPIVRSDVYGNDWYQPKGGGEAKFSRKIHSQNDLNRKGIQGKYLGAEIKGYNKDGMGVLGDKNGKWSFNAGSLEEVVVKLSEKNPQKFKENKEAFEIERWRKTHDEGYGAWRIKTLSNSKLYPGINIYQNFDKDDYSAVTLPGFGIYIGGGFQDNSRALLRIKQHEYGHYLDMKNSSDLHDNKFLFYMKIGIPSLWNASTGYGGPHDYYWTEKRANKRAVDYFGENIDPDFVKENPIEYI